MALKKETRVAKSWRWLSIMVVVVLSSMVDITSGEESLSRLRVRV